MCFGRKLWCYPVFRAKIIHISREENEIDLRTCFNQSHQLSFYICHWVCILAILGFSHFSYLNILISEIIFIFIFFLKKMNACILSSDSVFFVVWTFFFFNCKTGNIQKSPFMDVKSNIESGLEVMSFLSKRPLTCHIKVTYFMNNK